MEACKARVGKLESRSLSQKGSIGLYPLVIIDMFLNVHNNTLVRLALNQFTYPLRGPSCQLILPASPQSSLRSSFVALPKKPDVEKRLTLRRRPLPTGHEGWRCKVMGLF